MSGLIEPERPVDRFSISLDRGFKLITDTYFNSFFECLLAAVYPARPAPAPASEVSGEGTVLLVRRSLANGDVRDRVGRLRSRRRRGPPGHRRRRARHVHHRETRGAALRPRRPVDAGPPPPRRVGCRRRPRPSRSGLVAGYCTFNREPFLLANVREPGGRTPTSSRRPGRADRRGRPGDLARSATTSTSTTIEELAAGDKLMVVEQGNYGGTGGFTRSILEAQGDRRRHPHAPDGRRRRHRAGERLPRRRLPGPGQGRHRRRRADARHAPADGSLRVGRPARPRRRWASPRRSTGSTPRPRPR